MYLHLWNNLILFIYFNLFFVWPIILFIFRPTTCMQFVYLFIIIIIVVVFVPCTSKMISVNVPFPQVTIQCSLFVTLTFVHYRMHLSQTLYLNSLPATPCPLGVILLFFNVNFCFTHVCTPQTLVYTPPKFLEITLLFTSSYVNYLSLTVNVTPHHDHLITILSFLSHPRTSCTFIDQVSLPDTHALIYNSSLVVINLQFNPVRSL